MLISLIVFVVILLLSIPAALVFIPLAVLTGWIDPLYWAGCWIARCGFAAAFIRVRVEGRERVPRRQACIFMANHVSNLDPPALVPRLPGRTAIFLKKDLMKLPVLGYCFKLGSFIPVSRAGSAEHAKESVAAAHKVLESGLHITTFVEGTRSRDGRMLPFKKGPFFLAMLTGAPCVPVSIYGTEKLMAKGSFGIKPGTVHVVFHPPVNPADYSTREELMEAVRAAIASGLPEWMRGEAASSVVSH
ncbi:MAG: lysophospholipid acyltransferase family protein [Terracidiphilus sp.]